MTLVKMNFGDPVSGWNSSTLNGPTNTTIIADMLDDTGSTTGISLRAVVGGSVNINESRGSGEIYDWPDAVWDGVSFRSADLGYEIYNLSAYIGQTYTLKTAHFSNSVRDNDVTVDGTTLQYNSTAWPPAPLLEFTGTITGDSLFIDVTNAPSSPSTTRYLTGFTLELASATGPSIDNIDGDNEVRAGQQNVVITGTNIENATSVVLGGEALTIV